MERLLRRNGFLDACADATALLANRVSPKMGSVQPYEILWWIFAASVAFSTTSRIVGDVAAPLSYVMAVGGAAGCGWLWLLARALFRTEKPIQRWNLFAIGAIIAVEAYWELASASTSGAAAGGEIRRIAANAASFICIGALVLVFVEVLSGYSAKLPKNERRFRQTFTLTFGAMIAIALLWALNANENSFGAQWADATLFACAIGCVVGARMAVLFRRRNPLVPSKVRMAAQSPSSAANDQGLAQRILHALEQDKLYATPDLKVADLAATLCEQDYKVTQCVTGFLGYRNFNQMINVRRIDHAKQLLTDPDHEHRPILSIAFDCGFNSIGPFNRAFKQVVGMTPRKFRATVVDRIPAY